MPRDQMNHDRVELVIERAPGIEKGNRKVGLFQQPVVILGLAMRTFQVVKKLVEVRLLKQRCTPVYVLP